jgi:hypothetical protein
MTIWEKDFHADEMARFLLVLQIECKPAGLGRISSGKSSPISNLQPLTEDSFRSSGVKGQGRGASSRSAEIT